MKAIALVRVMEFPIPLPDALVGGIGSGENRAVGRKRERAVHLGIEKNRAFLGEAIKIGSRHLPSVDPQMIGAQGVDGHQEDRDRPT